MKIITILAISMLFISCQGSTNSTGNPNTQTTEPTPGAPVVTPIEIDSNLCKDTVTALDCLRLTCNTSGAVFNETQKQCECPDSFFLNTLNGLHCEKTTTIIKDNTGTDLVFGKTYIQGPNTNLDKLFLESAGKSLYSSGNRRVIFTYFDTNELLLDPKSLAFLNISDPGAFTVNLMNQTNIILNANANKGVSYQLTNDVLYQIAFIPKDISFIKTDDDELDAIIQASLRWASKVSENESFLSYTEKGCLDQCIAKSYLKTNSHFLVNRNRYYFRGGILQDHILIFDKNIMQVRATLFLINGKLAYYLHQEKNSTVLHSNEEDFEKSKVLTLQTYPNLKDIKLPENNFTENPVVIFETTKNDVLDSITYKGPWTNSHVLGWFRPEDNIPFWKNYQNFNADFGQDHVCGVTEMGHAINVANIASDVYKKPIIPMQDVDLYNETFGKFLKNFNDFQLTKTNQPKHRLTLSISESEVMTAKSCLNSPVYKYIVETQKNAIWVIGAGNSASELNESAYSCPQTIQADNVIHVASSGDGQNIAQSSTFGKSTVEIAEIGCGGPYTKNCDPSTVGTSYAAPRLAKKIAELFTEFPMASTQQIRFAVLVTARVPFTDGLFKQTIRPLPVKSGGFADINAAKKLLENLNTWPKDFSADSKEWILLLYKSKSDQYEKLSENKIKNLIKMQMQYFLYNKGI